MARKYEYKAECYAWNPEKCEEVVLIAAYDEISRFIPPDQTWKIEFENHFFDHGNGVAVGFLDQINAVRRRRGLDVIVIKETDIYDYARSRDNLLKSEHRRRVWDEIRNASLDIRQKRIEQAKAEQDRLPPPYIFLEALKARSAQHTTESGLSREEVTKRVLARRAADAAQVAPAKPTPDDVEIYVEMLRLADAALRIEIISTFSVAFALDVAKRVDDPELRNALVKHSFVKQQVAA